MAFKKNVRLFAGLQNFPKILWLYISMDGHNNNNNNNNK